MEVGGGGWGAGKMGLLLQVIDLSGHRISPLAAWFTSLDGPPGLRVMDSLFFFARVFCHA